MSAPVVIDARAKDQRRIESLVKDVEKLEQKIVAIRLCLQERRFGDALALTRPLIVTAPISASGGLA